MLSIPLRGQGGRLLHDGRPEKGCARAKCDMCAVTLCSVRDLALFVYSRSDACLEQTQAMSLLLSRAACSPHCCGKPIKVAGALGTRKYKT